LRVTASAESVCIKYGPSPLAGSLLGRPLDTAVGYGNRQSRNGSEEVKKCQRSALDPDERLA